MTTPTTAQNIFNNAFFWDSLTEYQQAIVHRMRTAGGTGDMDIILSTAETLVWIELARRFQNEVVVQHFGVPPQYGVR